MSSYQSTKSKGKDELPEESSTEYYEDRKKIIFKQLTIDKDEEYILGIVKKSQLKVNNKLKQCKRGGFFSIKQEDIYKLCLLCKKEDNDIKHVINDCEVKKELRDN